MLGVLEPSAEEWRFSLVCRYADDTLFTPPLQPLLSTPRRWQKNNLLLKKARREEKVRRSSLKNTSKYKKKISKWNIFLMSAFQGSMKPFSEPHIYFSANTTSLTTNISMPMFPLFSSVFFFLASFYFQCQNSRPLFEPHADLLLPAAQHPEFRGK